MNPGSIFMQPLTCTHWIIQASPTAGGSAMRPYASETKIGCSMPQPCEELEGLNAWWMNDGAGQSDCYRFIYNHLQTCPTCQARAASYGPPSEELTYRLENGKFTDTLEADLDRCAA